MAKSAKLKIVAGTDRPDRRRPKQTQRKSTKLSRVPAPPLHMSKEAKREWRRLAPKAFHLGTLTQSDLRAFELLCDTLAIEAEARQTLHNEGMTVTGANGGEKSHPAIGVIAQARVAIHKMLGDFGLTPKGRQMIDIAPEEDDQGKDSFFA